MVKSNKLALVAGAGPGLGAALLRCFEQQGLKAVGLTRTGKSDDDLDIRACDLCDTQTLKSLVDELIEQYGAPSIVVHNPATLHIAPFMQTELSQIEACWRSMVLSAASLAQCTIPAMVQAGGGSFIVSGATASVRGGAKFSAFASAKFALRGLSQSLAREFQPEGIHVVHTVLDGIIDSQKSRDLHALAPEKMMDADELAQSYWQLTQQPRSVWTHELDLRPQSEGF